MEAAVKEKQEYQRIEVSREECRSMFLENKFKLEMLDALPDDAIISVYRNGPMVDMCRGPHIPNTEMVKVRAPAHARAGCERSRSFEHSRSCVRRELARLRPRVHGTRALEDEEY